MRQYLKPAVSLLPLNIFRLRLQGTGEPLTRTNCTACSTFGLPDICNEGSDDYRFDLVLEDTTCEAAALDVSTCTITVGTNVFTNCISPGSGNISCMPGSQDCQVFINCLDTLQTCQLSDDGATVEINCPGFEVCSSNLVIITD